MVNEIKKVIDNSRAIQPYTEMKLDCYQNLLVTLLNHYGCNIELLGSILPWLFEDKNPNNGKHKITNQVVATDKRIEELFGYKVVRKYFSPDNILEKIAEEIEVNPIIVNVDQYYVPHHYIHIYKKKHGQHSLLLIGKEESGSIICVDTFPEYYGPISSESLKEGIENFPSLHVLFQYSLLSKQNNLKVKNLGEIFDDFILSAKKVECEASNEKNFSISYILLEVLKNLNTLSEDDFFHWLNSFCEGTWMCVNVTLKLVLSRVS